MNWLLGRSRSVAMLSALPMTLSTSVWNYLQRNDQTNLHQQQWLRFWNSRISSFSAFSVELSPSEQQSTTTACEDTGVMLMSSDEDTQPPSSSSTSSSSSSTTKKRQPKPKPKPKRKPQPKQAIEEDDTDDQLPPELDFRDMSYGDPNPNCSIQSDLREDETLSFEDEHPNMSQCAFCILFEKHTPCGHLFSEFKECSLTKIRKRRQAQQADQDTSSISPLPPVTQSADEQHADSKTVNPPQDNLKEEKEEELALSEDDLSKPDECMRPFIIFRKCMFHFPHYYSQRNKWLAGLYDAMERESAASSGENQEEQDQDGSAAASSTPSQE